MADEKQSVEEQRLEEPQPYPGLRFYDKGLSTLFAGRTQEIEDCAAVLVQSSILILHGRTGCGKSSFLRAGVKPKLERTNVGARFEGDVSDFEVIRSTQLPLRELARRIIAAGLEVKRLLEDIDKRATGPLGRLKRFVDDDDVDALLKILATGEPDQNALIDEICEGKRPILLELVLLIGNLLANAPIFVLDQAEEIFTLADAHQNTELSVDEKERLAKQYKRERRYYFDFLKEFVEKDPKSTLVISLRTEYKGLFDDSISHDKHPGPKLRGFYLKDLDKNGLIAAIKRPTLTREQIPDYELAGLNDDLIDFEFSIEQEVVDQLVEALESDEVPAGGILPTMQVACLRLWRMALAARPGKQRFKITRNHYQQLGQIQNQIEEYLAESLENCSVEIDWPVGDGRQTISDRWHQILHDCLVHVEADGRAVTRSIPKDVLIDRAKAIIGDVKDGPIKEMVEELSKPTIGILKKDKRDEETYWTLGHDSLALALNRWRLLFGQKTRDMMMRMGMSSVGAPDAYDQSQLYPKKADLPAGFTVLVPRDFSWDHQFPLFAKSRGFAERLGIRFITDDDFKAKNLSDNKGKVDWPALRQEIAERGETTTTRREEDFCNELVMFSADWNQFPGGGNFKPKEERKDGVGAFTIKSNLWKWTDLLVTDMFMGNGLIGEGTEWPNRLKEAMSSDSEKAISMLLELVTDALREIREDKGIIRCQEQTGVQFLEFAARLVDDREFITYIKKGGNLGVMKNADYQSYDQLLSWMLEEEFDDAGNKRPKYIVGSAQSRTLAMQAGLSIYFGTNNLAAIARRVMSQGKKRGKIGDRMLHIANMSEEMQRIVVHTLWQVGIPASHWDIGINRPIVLRLASLGYFTSEYIRTNADEYIMHLHDFVNEIFRNARKGKNAGRDMRINRAAMRRSWQDCFSISKFDEVGPENYDPGSIYAYLPQHAKYGTKSVAAEIYAELISLRARTNEHFNGLAQSIAWLNTRLGEDVKDNDALWEAYSYREAAWKHYRILNFYDSERFMAKAAQILRTEIEVVAKGAEAG